jgi:hypothetical protein
MVSRRLPALVLLLAVTLAAAARAQDWTPDAWAAEDTLELTTVDRADGPYSFPVWLVVLDGDVYVRLGSRAATRVEGSTTAPFVGVTVGGQRFERVRAEPAPDMAARVAQAMADKYWTDVFVRWLPHPLTARLRPE